MNIQKSIEGTVFERARNEYYASLPSEEAKDAAILKVLYVLLSR